MSAILIDTETTGVDEPEVIELAYLPIASPAAMPEGDGVQMQFRPSKPISLGAMATHHIIPEDLVDCDPWPGSWAPPAELDSVDYLVGHNIDFDWKAIGSPKIKRICTLALARHVWPKLDSHQLGALIYHLYPPSMARKLVRGAHSALTDVGLCGRLLFALVDTLQPRDWAHLWELSEQARVPTVMPMGKHKGVPIAQVPRDYKAWLLRQSDVDPYLRKALTV